MKFIFIFIGIGFLFIFLWLNNRNKLKRKGRYPSSKATMFDVRRYIIKGDRELAIQLYGEIFKTNRKESLKAIDELERSIRQKGFKI